MSAVKLIGVLFVSCVRRSLEFDTHVGVLSQKRESIGLSVRLKVDNHISWKTNPTPIAIS